MRELELVVRDIALLGHHERSGGAKPGAQRLGGDDLAARVQRAELSLDELRDAYILHVFADCGNYREAARRLGIDRRTVTAVVRRALRDGGNGSGSNGAAGPARKKRS